MVYTRNQPISMDDLDISQPFLATNTNAADDSFGIDHYQFSDLTVNNGFHNKVTTPVFVDSPPTGLPPVTVANPVLYGFQNSANVGVLQYTRGPNNAVPTPLTSLQAPAAGINLPNGNTSDVLDFNGLPGTLCKLYAASMTATPASNEFYVVWNGTTLTSISPVSSSAVRIQAQASGTILQIKNSSGSNLTSVVWTLEFKRIS